MTLAIAWLNVSGENPSGWLNVLGDPQEDPELSNEGLGKHGSEKLLPVPLYQFHGC